MYASFPPHPLGYKLTVILSSLINPSINIRNTECVIPNLPEHMKVWLRTSTPTIQHKEVLNLRAPLESLNVSVIYR
jgi:hypothetical protein